MYRNGKSQSLYPIPERTIRSSVSCSSPQRFDRSGTGIGGNQGLVYFLDSDGSCLISPVGKIIVFSFSCHYKESQPVDRLRCRHRTKTMKRQQNQWERWGPTREVRQLYTFQVQRIVTVERRFLLRFYFLSIVLSWRKTGKCLIRNQFL